MLDSPLATNASKVVYNADGSISVWKDTDSGVEQVKLKTKPVVISCESRLNVPRFVNIMGLRKAKSKKIEVVKLEDLTVKQDSGYKITHIREHEKKRSSQAAALEQIVKLIQQSSSV